MTDRNRVALYIAQKCIQAGMTAAGAAGVLANVEAESAFKPTNLQDSYERSLGYNDESYTAAVDHGTYSNFTGDAAGYGLAQWTAGDRKAKMLAFHRQRGMSIGDLATQVDFLISEMRGYGKAWNTCTQSGSPYDCGYAVCRYYEIPADTEAQAQHRGGQAGKWYEFIRAADLSGMAEIPETAALNPGGAGALPEPELDEDGNPIERAWPPRTLQKGRCSGWPEVRLLQAALRCRGYNVLQDGVFGDKLEEKAKAFQSACNLTADGIVGPMTWGALGVKMNNS